MVCTVRRWGNSLAVRLPRAVAAEVSIGDGSAVMVQAVDGIITIAKMETPTYLLADLVRSITPRNRHASIETSRPVGNEVW
jgi:antitoxin MazE